MGGLGNQLFQVALAINISLDTARKIIFNEESFQHDSLRDSFLEVLGLKALQAYSINISEEQIFFEAVETTCRCQAVVVNEVDFCFKEVNLPTTKCILNGYWQSLEYFNKNSIYIRNLYLEKLFSGNTAFPDEHKHAVIHIRLGDVSEDPIKQEKHGLLPVEFFIDAINILGIKEKYIIVTDTVEIVKLKYLPSFIKSFPETEFEIYDNDTLNSLNTIRNGNMLILSNSTFSWWGGFLSEAKIVLAPRKLFTKKYLRILNTCDFWPEGWLIL